MPQKLNICHSFCECLHETTDGLISMLTQRPVKCSKSHTLQQIIHVTLGIHEKKLKSIAYCPQS